MNTFLPQKIGDFVEKYLHISAMPSVYNKNMVDNSKLQAQSLTVVSALEMLKKGEGAWMYFV